MMAAIIAVVVVILLIVWYVSIYNGFITTRNQVEESARSTCSCSGETT